jgi:hypothetical protein
MPQIQFELMHPLFAYPLMELLGLTFVIVSTYNIVILL